MGRRSRDDPPDSTRGSFADAMERAGDVDSIDRQSGPRVDEGVAPARGEPPPVRFVIPDADEPLAGHAPGVQRRVLRRLRSSNTAPDRTIDLHGLDRTSARRLLRAEMADAIAQGCALVRIIHGKGRHSEAEPVLRASLPAWLAEAPHGSHIRAFAPAPPARGGRGATHVWLHGARR
jgi:DNA-nicking Smr family endonuclease